MPRIDEAELAARRAPLLWEGHTGEPDRCAGCGAPLRCQEVPDPADERAWVALARSHRPRCPWVATRGRRRAPGAVYPRTA